LKIKGMHDLLSSLFILLLLFHHSKEVKIMLMNIYQFKLAVHAVYGVRPPNTKSLLKGHQRVQRNVIKDKTTYTCVQQ